MIDTTTVGYTWPTTELIKLLPPAIQPQFIDAIETGNMEALANLFRQHAPAEFPRNVEFFKWKPGEIYLELMDNV
jgi:hypothetical protein